MIPGSSSYSLPQRRLRWGPRALLIAGSLVAGACVGASSLPPPRSLVVRSGARIFADEARLNEIDIWVRAQQENIVIDPSFMILTTPTQEENYPWDALRINRDTAEVFVYTAAPDARTVLSFYGHFHLMDSMDRLDEWLPEGVGAEGYQLERAILARVSDAWLYARSVFDFPPYAPLDELMFSRENGYLDAFLLTARPELFEEERATWLRENPGREEQYTRWFLETFEVDAPGLRQSN